MRRINLVIVIIGNPPMGLRAQQRLAKLPEAERAVLMLDTPEQRTRVALPIADDLERLAKAMHKGEPLARRLAEAAWAWRNAGQAATDLDARCAISRARRAIAG